MATLPIRVMSSKNSIVKEKNHEANSGALASLHCSTEDICVDIYVAENCFICAYAYEVADMIRQDFPQVKMRIINLSTTNEEIPDVVFATPTYLLNGRVWSLGNPSPQQVIEKLQGLL